MEINKDTVIMAVCLGIIALVWIKYFATYFIKQAAKRRRERKLEQIRKEIVESGGFFEGVVTIPPLKQGYDNTATDVEEPEPTYIVIKLKP